ncbi:hypothetical protein SNL152K_10599 [Streptomyces sp. NL15-2K]|nr:hypothetical protein SNL152K_10599 [Streptomyces sp. NL15-2K]
MRHPTRRHQLDQPTTRQHLVRRRHHQRRTRAQRHQNFRHRRVKTDRGELRHPRRLLHRKPLTLSSHQIHQTSVGKRHTLRRPRRPGRIDHIRQPRRVDRHLWRSLRHGANLGPRPRVIQPHQRGVCEYIGQVSRCGGTGKHHRHAAVGHHETDPLRRIPHINRQERCPRLQHGQHPGYQLRTPRQAQAHHRLTPHTHAPQIVREPIRLGLQLAVSQGGLVVDHRDRVRSGCHPPPEQLHHRRIRHHIRGRVIPPTEQQLTLVRAEHVNRAQGHIRVVGECVDHVRRRRAQQCAQRTRIEHVNRLHTQTQTPRPAIVDRDRHRIVGPLLREDRPYPRHRPLSRRAVRRVSDVPVVEQRGEERRIAHDTTDPLRHRQRRMLMLQQRGQLLPHPLDRRAHPYPTDRQPHGKRVDERAHHTVRTRARVHPPQQHRAEHHVIPPGQHSHHPRPHHMQHGRRTDSQFPRHPPQSLNHLIGDRHSCLDHLAAVPAHIEEPVRRGRLGHITQQLGEEPLVLLPRHRPRLRHEIPERQRRRQPIRLTGESGVQFAQQDVHAHVVQEQVMHPHQPEPAALRQIGRMQIHQRRTPQVHHRTRQGDQSLHRVRMLTVDLVLYDR